jgi:hypothetical protein
MIKYALICDQGHTFESWFSNAEGYDTQVKRGFVECPTCQTKQVSKAMMAPAVSTSRRKEAIAAQTAAMTAAAMQAQAQAHSAVAASAPPAPAAAAPAQPVALLDEGQQALRAMVRELHEKLTENSTDVGDRFTTEARDMQSGDTPLRPIHGRATLEEAKALIEEGVPVMPLPTLPDEWN